MCTCQNYISIVFDVNTSPYSSREFIAFILTEGGRPWKNQFILKGDFCLEYTKITCLFCVADSTGCRWVQNIQITEQFQMWITPWILKHYEFFSMHGTVHIHSGCPSLFLGSFYWVFGFFLFSIPKFKDTAIILIKTKCSVFNCNCISRETEKKIILY